MESLIKASKNQKFSALIAVVITDNELASGILLAKNYNIPIKVFDKKNSTNHNLKLIVKKYY